MAGYILYNGFWNAQAVPDSVRRLEQAGARAGFALRPLPNTALCAEYGTDGTRVAGISEGDTVLCFDKDVRLLRAMEQVGAHVYNSADSVALCDDKSATHRVLAAGGIPIPRTLVAPMTYVHYDAAGEAFLRYGEQELGYPLVLKECYGSLGEQVYLIEDAAALRKRAAACGAKPFLLQQYIAAAHGTDKRLYVIGDRVAAAMRRCAETDFRANIALGSRGEAYTPTAEEAALAVRCCRLLGLHFGGVDLLTEADGSPLVCEVNASAQMAGITACTGVEVADEIVRYVLRCEQNV